MTGIHSSGSGELNSKNNYAYMQVDASGELTGLPDYLDPAELAHADVIDTLTAARNTLRHAEEIGNAALAAEMRSVIAYEQQ